MNILKSQFNDIDADKNGLIDVKDWMGPVKDYAAHVGSETLDKDMVSTRTKMAMVSSVYIILIIFIPFNYRRHRRPSSAS